MKRFRKATTRQQTKREKELIARIARTGKPNMWASSCLLQVDTPSGVDASTLSSHPNWYQWNTEGIETSATFLEWFEFPPFYRDGSTCHEVPGQPGVYTHTYVAFPSSLKDLVGIETV